MATRLINRILTIPKIMVIIGLLVGMSGVIYLEANLPDVEVLKDVQLQVPLKIYTADAKLIAEFGEKRRTPVELSEVPRELLSAIIATEDRRFYQHPGVDLRGLLRAFVSLVTKGTKEQGGSTITMQVARNFFLTRKKTYSRKFNEILLALKIEQELTKDEILELYINKIYFGKRAYGIAAAAEVYYGTSVDKLTLAQMAMLAGLPQAPSSINPINSPESALKRRNHVLERMLVYNFISYEQYQSAVQAEIDAKYHGRPIEIEAPYIAEMVRSELLDKYGEDIYVNGYEVYTTIDSKTQVAANDALRRALLEYDKRHGYRNGDIFPLDGNLTAKQQLELWIDKLKEYREIQGLHPAIVASTSKDYLTAVMANNSIVEVPLNSMQWVKRKNLDSPDELVKIGEVIYLEQKQDKWGLSQIPEVEGAIVAVNPSTGEINSLVGGFNFYKSKFNRATQAERQPGSSFKPFIYGSALENGFTTATIVNDAPIVQEDPVSDIDWRPQNSNKKFYGPTRLRTGITFSRNLVSIRLLQSLGIDKVINFASKCGFDEQNMPRGLSLALGTNHVTPLKLASAYSVFANGGSRITPYLINKIIDYQDQIIFQAEPSERTQVIAPQTAYLMTSLLQDVIKHGSGRKALSIGRSDLAGKTGTTSKFFDAWYAGYNKDLVATVWMGFDEPQSLHEYSVKSALPMWIYFIQQALKGKPESSPPQPAGLITVKIDPKTGLLANHNQSNSIYEIFTKDTVPTASASGTNDGGTTDSQSSVEMLF